MSIIWHKEEELEIYVTISSNCIILNKHCSNLLVDYSHCMLGFEDADNSIVIKPVGLETISKSSTDAKIYRLNFTESYSRISCTDFINTLKSDYDLKLEKKQKVIADWKIDDSLLKIAVDK